MPLDGSLLEHGKPLATQKVHGCPGARVSHRRRRSLIVGQLSVLGQCQSGNSTYRHAAHALALLILGSLLYIL